MNVLDDLGHAGSRFIMRTSGKDADTVFANEI